MYPKQSDEHFSNEILVAYADGEVSWWRRRVIERHLLQCWRCRTRLAEFGRQVERVSGLMSTDAFPGPSRLAEARLKLVARQWRVEARLSAEALRQSAHGMPLPRAARIAACVVVVSSLGLGFWARFSGTRAPVASQLVPKVRRWTPEPVSKEAAPPVLKSRPAPRPMWREIPAARITRSSAALELDLMLALHYVEACSGEPVELTADQGGGFTVRGVVRDTARLEEIAAAVKAAGGPDVRLALRTMEETAADSHAQQLGVESVDEYRSEITPFERVAGKMPRQRVVEVANAAVGAAEAAMAQAWAIRRLEDRFPAERLALLDRPEREIYAAMATDHLRWLELELTRLRIVVRPALEPLVGAGRQPEDRDWMDDWFGAVQRGAGLTRHLFAGGAARTEDGRQAARDVLDIMCGLETGWKTLSARVAGRAATPAMQEAKR